MFKFLKEKIQSIFKSDQEEVVDNLEKVKKEKTKQKDKKTKQDKKSKKPKKIQETKKAIKESKEIIQEDLEKEIEKEFKEKIEEKIKKEEEKLIAEEKIIPVEKKDNLELSQENTAEEEIKDKKSFFSFFKRKKDNVKEESSISQPVKEELIKKEEITALEEKAKDIVKKEEKGIFSKIGQKFSTVRIDQEKFNEIFEKLEFVLIESNVALEVIDKIKIDMEKSLLNSEIKKDLLELEIKNTLKKSLEEILLQPFDIMEKIMQKNSYPFVILFFGINGAGKTTTIAKIAHFLKEKNMSCVIAASDTFRAASIEQLQQHGEKLGVKIIHHDYGADPSAVAFDAIKYAQAHGINVVLIDTAGRMHTKENLLKEMEKIVRVTKPDLKIFVAESITGNDATQQAKNFNDTAGIDGSILSKADVDEKGGTAISIGYVTGKPIIYLGVGQNYSDLAKFSPQEVIKSLGLD